MTTDSQGARLDELTEEEWRAWRAFLAARATITQHVEADLADATDLSHGELDVLHHLSQNNGTMRMSRLANEVHASRSGLTRRIDRMAEQGLLERRSAPEDKRGSYAVLTEKGRAAYAVSFPLHVASLKTHVFAGVSNDELPALTAVLEKLAGISG